MRVAVFAALPQELDPIVRQLKAVRVEDSPLPGIYQASDSLNQILLVMTGMGLANAADAIRHIHDKYKPDVIVSIGFGGALYPEACGGEIVLGTEFFLLAEAGISEALNIPLEEDLLARLGEGMSIRRGAIVSLPCLTQKKEIINKLPADVSNPVCDMETYAIADFCAVRGIRFFAIRGITDLSNQDITSDIAGIVDESGQADILRAIKTVLKKPQIIPALIRLGIYSHRASGNLKAVTTQLLEALR